MKTLSPGPTAAWADVRPLLDGAVAGLGAKDRTAVILRYFERRSLAEVGEALGISENAAQMRVSRALDKLRAFFGRRGVALTVSGIAVLLTTNATEAAPTGVPAGLSVASLKALHAKPAGLLAGRVSQEMLLRRLGQAAAMVAATVLIVAGLGMAGTMVKRLPRPTTPSQVVETSEPFTVRVMSFRH